MLTIEWIVTGREQMMKVKLKFHSSLAVCLMAVLGCTGNQNSTAADTGPWKQEIKCGNTRYQITSECVASGSDMELNTCTQQTLTQLNTNKTITLPNPTKADAKGIAKAGNKGRLFVTSWSCELNASDQYLRLNYYAGTGRSQYDEYDEIYDKNLSPIHLSNRKLADELIIKAVRRHGFPAAVKSIMPFHDEDAK